MLWYKSWLETRWRFLIGLALLLCSAGATVLVYPKILQLTRFVPANVSGEIGERIREAAALSREYRGYVWSQWFRQNLPQWGTLFAVLLGAAGALSTSAGALFTLSLPISRARLLTVRAALGLGELFLLTLVPSLLIPLLSPTIGETYSIVDAIVHSVCFFVVVSAFFSLALLLSTVFDDVWRPVLIALGIAFVLSLLSRVYNRPYSGYGLMSAESYFRSGHIPWLGLLASAAVSALLIWAATSNLSRRDF
ncbi:MAG TPA: hypothetical protein VKU62_09635 [Thermoanaerobaculia bacterium]|nr:hypothetical protein [Thermoanaerobaculia bacterium]